MRWLLRSKIHKATVTEANVGSLTLDSDLIEKAGFLPEEKLETNIFILSEDSQTCSKPL